MFLLKEMEMVSGCNGNNNKSRKFIHNFKEKLEKITFFRQ
jgi:hypothetical protein